VITEEKKCTRCSTTYWDAVIDSFIARQVPMRKVCNSTLSFLVDIKTRMAYYLNLISQHALGSRFGLDGVKPVVIAFAQFSE
jgi:predicted dithiol-disulfide oxidoreductase (DUF899 family)